MLRKLRRRLRILTLLPAAFWLYRERHVLAGMAGFARTVPDRLRLGRGSEVALAAKVNLALLREPQLKGADLRLGAVQDGDVCIEAGAGAEAAADAARRIVERIPGVTSVRVESTQAHAASSVVTGQGAVADLTDGAVEAPTGDAEAPVRI